MNESEDWFVKILESYTRPPVNVNGMQLPAFPPDEIQVNTTGQAGEATLREAFVFYEDCLNTFREIGSELKSNHKLLDFGVG